MFVSPACVVGAAKYLLIYDWNFTRLLGELENNLAFIKKKLASNSMLKFKTYPGTNLK